MRKLSMVIIVLTICTVFAAACGNGNSSPSSSPSASNAAPPSSSNPGSNAEASPSPTVTSKLLQEVIANKKIEIGTSNDAPWSTVTADGKAEGIVPDIIRGFLTYMNVDAEISSTAMPFGSIIPSIQSGRIQIVGDAMYKTAERQEQIDFTDILFYNPEALVVKKGNPQNIKSLEDLAGKAAGTYEGTTWIETLNSIKGADGSKVQVSVYPTIQDVMADVESGRLAAALIDSSVSSYAISQNPNLNLELVAEYSPDKAAVANGIGIAKGDPEFITLFNEYYAQALSSGEIKGIFEKWGLTPADYWINK
ncbi:substrate-binding periplasmic protein [Paenibacillus zanthoxyli]|uniref:substrate-binding periplasmic protein n=1 Tax=Paenibacillus zanthoxyli TaxID=369399 RepID=UPI0004721CAF|nr:transporter substrate-binding domain-containing protein [Paenibacillus zanthoxyli]